MAASSSVVELDGRDCGREMELLKVSGEVVGGNGLNHKVTLPLSPVGKALRQEFTMKSNRDWALAEK